MGKEDEYVPRLISRRHHRPSALRGQAIIEMFFKFPSSKKLKKLVTTPNKNTNSSTFHDTSPARSTKTPSDNLSQSLKIEEDENDENRSPTASVPRQSARLDDSRTMFSESCSTSKDSNASEESENGGWRSQERCINCWRFAKLSKPYRLCSQSKTLLHLEAATKSNSANPFKVQKQFDAIYTSILKKANALSKIPAIPSKEVWMPSPTSNCFYCGKYGSRRNGFCTKCKDKVFAPL